MKEKRMKDEQFRFHPSSFILPPSSIPKYACRPVDRQIPLLRHLREEEVQDDDGDEAGDEAFGARPADTAGAGAAGKAFVAADHPDGGAEEDALDDAFK